MRLSLLLLLFFVVISAIPSGLILMFQPSGDLMGLSTSLLAHAPFQNFFIPGLLLTALVGGTSLTAIILLTTGNTNAYRLSLVAGIILFFWIVGQMSMVHYYQWLQGLYLVVGLLISLLSYQLMGKAAF